MSQFRGTVAGLFLACLNFGLLWLNFCTYFTGSCAYLASLFFFSLPRILPLITMNTPNFFACKYCGKPNFRSKAALRSHLRTSYCGRQQEAELRQRNPSRGPLFRDEPLDDDYVPMDDDDLPPLPPPNPPRKVSAARQAVQAVEAHDIDAITLQMGNLLQETASFDGQEESVDDEDARAKGTEDPPGSEDEGLDSPDEDAANPLDEPELPDEGHKNEDSSTKDVRPDTWIRGQFREYCAKAKKENKPFTEHEISSIKLIDLLHKKNAPLNTYNALMLWHLQESKKLYSNQGLGEYHHFIGRKAMLENLKKRYNFENKMPFKRKVKLPVSGTVVELTLHHAKGVIQRLLTDPRIEAEDYLFWEPGNPLAPPPETVEVVKDLNTGRAYLDTYGKLIDPEGREALMPVVIYFDGTAVSHFHNMEVIQVNIALGTYTRMARNKEFLWASLGSIEKISEQGGRGRDIIAQANHMETEDAGNSDSESEDSDDPDKETMAMPQGVGDKKDQDFHAMMEVVLEEFVALQETGFIWDHQDPGTGEEVTDIHYKIFVPFLKLDGKEADLACGKYSQRSTAQQICRKCHIPLDEADDHMARYKLKTVSEIKKLIDKADLDGLKALSQTYLRNAFHKVRFSMGNDHGVHGACPIELLHAFLLGTFKYVRDTFFEVIGKTSEGARKINALAKVYGRLFVRQSDRTQPGTFFTRGIQVGKLMAKDYRGVLLLMLAIVRSTTGRNILMSQRKSSLRNNEKALDDWILLIELMLEWESYMNEPEMARKHVVRLEKKHRFIMYIMRKVAQRTEGMGLKTSKFHSIIHIWDDILQYGVPLEYDTSANESFHKPTKAASKMTQRSAVTFNYQTAKRLVEFFLIGLAMEEIETGRVIWNYYDRKPLRGRMDSDDFPPPWTGDTQIVVYRDPDSGDTGFIMKSKSRFKAQTRWNGDIVDFLVGLQEALDGYLPDNTLQIFTCHRRDGQIFRGHPNYRGKGPWKDWAWIDWGPGYGRLPSHIWCFVRLDHMPTGRNTIHYGGIRLTDGVFAVAETAKEEEITADWKSELITPILKEVQLDADKSVEKRNFYLADTEAIMDPACVIPDLGGATNRYFVVMPRNQWAKEFVKWVIEEHNKDEMEDLAIVEEEMGEEEEEGSAEEADSGGEDQGSGDEEPDDVDEEGTEVVESPNRPVRVAQKRRQKEV